jgi:hypothetical protein
MVKGKPAAPGKTEMIRFHRPNYYLCIFFEMKGVRIQTSSGLQRQLVGDVVVVITKIPEREKDYELEVQLHKFLHDSVRRCR